MAEIQDAPPADYLPARDPDVIATNQNVPFDRTEASAFIAPEVSPFGELISPGYDSQAADLQAAKAKEAAMRYKGQQQYAALIERGATPAEAYRATGHLLNYSNPLIQVKTDEMLKRSQPIVPQLQNIGGVKMIQTGPRSWQRVPEPKTPMPPVLRIPAEVKMQDEILKGQLDSKRRELLRGTKGSGPLALPMNDQEKAALQAEITGLEKSRMDLVAPGGVPIPELNPKVDQAGWEAIKKDFNAPAEEVIRVTKDGRRAAFDPQTQRFIRYVQ